MRPEEVRLPVSEENKAYVYIMNFNSGNIKIGLTTNPLQRINQLSNSNSGGFRLTDVVFSPQTLIADSLERYLHGRFEKYRVEGEFFSGVDYQDAVKCLWGILNDRQYENCVRAREVYIRKSHYHKNLTQYHRIKDKETSEEVCINEEEKEMER